MKNTPLLLLLVGLLGCGSATGPTWVHLAAAPAADGAGEPARRVVEELLPAPAWSAVAGAVGRWETAQPLLAIGLPPAQDGQIPPFELRAGERPYVYARDAFTPAAEPGTFTVAGGRIQLQLGAEETPSETVFSVSNAHDARVARVDGDDGARTISGRRFSGEGLVVWPGETLEVTADVPHASALRFATTVEAALTSKVARQSLQTFRVFLDGAPIFEHEQGAETDSIEWHTVDLPRGGARGVRFTFEVEGPFAYTAFQSPIVGPAEVGTPFRRPWESPPDVVVFLADTFRADNLTAYGGQHDLTPNLDAFCAQALVARNAYSVSTHTLPAHSSMFSGVFPRQNGLVDYWNPLPAAVETLAELLARRGYRTAAITDGIMVSQSHGMAQGFELFDERGHSLDQTLERARSVLEADEGRPLFLFVQTYATHAPYRIRARTRERLQAQLDLTGDFDELLYSLERATPDSSVVDFERPGAPETVARLRQLYLGSVADLDDAFGEFLQELRRTGRLPGGYLLLASDHGEAFCEHTELFHAGVTYEEQIRVPFILHGPGVEPGVLEHPVSLIDFGPTVLALAGVAAPRAWSGRSVLGLDEDRPIFAFQCRDALGSSTLAVVDGPHKLIGYENAERLRAGNWIGAFALDEDPGEHEDLRASADWPRPTGERFAPVLEHLMVPLVEGERLNVSAEELERLRAMGYGGE